MSTIDITQRPKRADARRNYDKLIAAARVAFTEKGSAASLEDVARRAGVGIGTLYRHFPTRQDLVEAVYLEEVEGVCRAADNLADAPPWEGLVTWLHSIVAFARTKQALSDQLLEHIDRDAPFFTQCRGALYSTGEPLLQRAQEAGVVRPDARVEDVLYMVSGIAKAATASPEDTARILDIALDGLRYRA
jgi:AcrR family transcriptional regulator